MMVLSGWGRGVAGSSRPLRAGVIALLMVASAVVIVPNAKAAGFVTRLPFSDFGAIEVDHANERIFVTSGAEDYQMVVLDFSGNVVRRFRGLAGPGGIFVRGDSVFVLLANFGDVLRLDRETLEPRRTYHIPFPANREDLQWAAGRLWTASHGWCSWWTTLTSLDPATGAATLHRGPEISRSFGELRCPGIRSSARHPGQLFAWDRGHSNPLLHRYDVTGRPTSAASVATEIEGSMRDVAIGEEHLYLVGGAPYGIEVHRWDTLERVGHYLMEPYPVAVELSPDGTEVAGASRRSGNTIWIFDTVTGQETARYELGESSEFDPADAGLAYGPGGTLFVVTGTDAELWVRSVAR